MKSIQLVPRHIYENLIGEKDPLRSVGPGVSVFRERVPFPKTDPFPMFRVQLEKKDIFKRSDRMEPRLLEGV